MYAVEQDFIDRIGNDQLLLLTDRDADGSVDSDVLDEAISDATAEIDSYLGDKYTLPLPSVPKVLVRICIDIAVYRLAYSPDLQTEDIRTRYEDCVKFLKSVAKGEISLGLSVTPDSSIGVVTISGPTRIFKRGSMP